ncbi:DNA-processing protein DprA [Roseibium algae]|uniref:DNA-processing protein DprA n=1 Tax=Roseibium algae TaxID=3123038 RepID=A0ABU8TRB6_9HYPH
MNNRATSKNALILNEAQRLAWLRLIRSENVGPATFRDLLNHFGSAEAALDALPSLSRRGGKSAIRVCPLNDAEAEIESHQNANARLIALGEPDYPPHLRHIDGPPPLISVKGGQTLAEPKMVAVVGARNASLSGRKLAAQFSRELGHQGYAIASGLARGIDAAAHEAATTSGTTAVFAGGIDILYPPEHGRLLEALLSAGGNAISEMPFGWKPRGRDFPRRNRLISGMSLGVIVIEAAKKSGSLHTARFALDQNREIFAVPGSPLDPRSEGANGLIRQGAMLVTSSKDVLEALADRIAPELPFTLEIEEPTEDKDLFSTEPSDSARERLVSALGPTPVEIDEIIRFTGESTRIIHVLLLELELAGRLERHSGQRVSLLL